MLVSFIIPHKGREELLNLTMQSILNLEFDLEQIEIIVVTQNKKLEEFTICPNISSIKVVFRPEHETIASLRNTGGKIASGEYLAFLDADVQISRNWLVVMFAELETNSECVLVSAIQQSSPNSGIIEKIRVILNNISADRPVEFLGTANLFITRKIFEEVGGFPEEIITCEDYYFTNEVHQIGELYCTSQASFIHLGEDKSYSELFRKEIWRGQSNLQSLRGRKIVLREIPSILTPLWQTFFFLATILTVLLGKITAVLFCFVMVSIPVVLYAVRLYKIGRSRVSFIESLWFYCVYHSARIIGTITGVFRIIRV